MILTPSMSTSGPFSVRQEVRSHTLSPPSRKSEIDAERGFPLGEKNGCGGDDERFFHGFFGRDRFRISSSALRSGSGESERCLQAAEGSGAVA